jgi:hypothetical protein
MVNFHEIQVGDLLDAEYEGKKREGTVTDMNADDKEICVETEVQAFWYAPEHLFPIPLDENQLLKFGFERQEDGGQSVKYLRGPFRILLPEKGNFNSFEMWYREDRRHIHHPISVHELQNHYLQMTKVDLTR